MVNGVRFEVLIVGAGPVGLALAQALKPLGLRVALVEQAPRAALVDPAFDGREIALTQHSVRLLRALGVWSHLPPTEVSPLRDARVLNGADPLAMTIRHTDAPVFGGMAPTELGVLVGNHRLRRALFETVFDPCPSAAASTAQPSLFAGQAVVGVSTDAQGARVVLADGTQLTADVVVAADSRHSSVRRQLGIAADVHDFGRSMLVCVMTHDEPHHHAAWEWFDHGQTLALLPMNPCPQSGSPRSSVVLTLAAAEMLPIQDMATAAFDTEMTRRFAHRLGRMRLSSTRHVYPLMAVYPRRLVGPRLACVGDAACGMHPVTAHGFNLGLKSIEALTDSLQLAQKRQRPLHDPACLAQYERRHWLASRPLYEATQLIVQLYTQEHLPARCVRQAALRLAQAVPFVRQAIAASLM